MGHWDPRDIAADRVVDLVRLLDFEFTFRPAVFVDYVTVVYSFAVVGSAHVQPVVGVDKPPWNNGPNVSTEWGRLGDGSKV